MSGFGNNLSLNILAKLRNIGKQAGDFLNKQSKSEKQAQNVQNVQNLKINTPKSLVNTNSNVSVNQTTLNSPSVTQSTLNSSNEPQIILTSNMKQNQNIQAQPSPSQIEFQGPKDLPQYAGISNMSLKSWVASQDTKSFAKTDSGEKLLTSTLEGIKGFQRKNYDPSQDSSEEHEGSRSYRLTKGKGLLLLSHIFSSLEKSSLSETELLVNINNFKKLGSALKEKNASTSDKQYEIKVPPPLPDDFQKLDVLDARQIRFLSQLLVLPKEFPEAIRLFAKEGIEISERDLHTFLTQRFEMVQEQILGVDYFLNLTIAKFIPLLNQIDYPIILPLLLLYYPLPLPTVKNQEDGVFDWERNKKDSKEENILATCDVYYFSKSRGRFLLRFNLNTKCELTLDVETSQVNNGIVGDIEMAVGESMYLLENPPNLSDLNVLLTKEIYKATDIDEELAIISSGPLRVEIAIAVYAALVVLNKLNEEPDPRGIIEMVY